MKGKCSTTGPYLQPQKRHPNLHENDFFIFFLTSNTAALNTASLGSHEDANATKVRALPTKAVADVIMRRLHVQPRYQNKVLRLPFSPYALLFTVPSSFIFL
jgi:hypothetical protein